MIFDGLHRPDHAQPVTRPGDRRQPRVRRQRPIWHADSHLTASPLPTPYPVHQIDTFPLAMTLTAAINIIPGQSGTGRHLQRRVTDLLADSGQTAH
jgi:hypothetical protein